MDTFEEIFLELPEYLYNALNTLKNNNCPKTPFLFFGDIISIVLLTRFFTNWHQNAFSGVTKSQEKFKTEQQKNL
jgi:hypothetical protein